MVVCTAIGTRNWTAKNKILIRLIVPASFAIFLNDQAEDPINRNISLQYTSKYIFNVILFMEI